MFVGQYVPKIDQPFILLSTGRFSISLQSVGQSGKNRRRKKKNP